MLCLFVNKCQVFHLFQKKNDSATHGMKSVLIRSFFRSIFSRIRTDCEELLCKEGK